MSAFGQVGKFVFNYNGADIVSVRLPRVVNVQGLFDLQNSGMTINESLPNITGKFNSAYNSDNLSGAFGWQGTMPAQGPNNSSFTGGMNFDASRSSSIYGKSNTVQPPATQMFLYFYVGEFARNSVQQTAGLNSELFNGKADLNFNNMNPSQTAKNTIVDWGLPDYSAGVDYANDTTVHTAPSNGVLEISYPVAAVTTGYLKINGIDAAASFHTGGYLTMLTGQYMLSEGDTFQITSPAYVVSGSLPFIYRFYPCKGAN